MHGDRLRIPANRNCYRLSRVKGFAQITCNDLHVYVYFSILVFKLKYFVKCCQSNNALGPQKLTKFDNSLHFTWSNVIHTVTAAVVWTTADQVDLVRSTHLLCTRYENNNST